MKNKLMIAAILLLVILTACQPYEGGATNPHNPAQESLPAASYWTGETTVIAKAASNTGGYNLIIAWPDMFDVANGNVLVDVTKDVFDVAQVGSPISFCLPQQNLHGNAGGIVLGSTNCFQ